jgi:hypothetical protein
MAAFLAGTDRLVAGNGIANVWARQPASMLGGRRPWGILAGTVRAISSSWVARSTKRPTWGEVPNHRWPAMCMSGGQRLRHEKARTAETRREHGAIVEERSRIDDCQHLGVGPADAADDGRTALANSWDNWPPRRP